MTAQLPPSSTRVIVAFRANRILTGQMTGQLNAAGPDRIDARRRRSRPDDTALAQPANALSGRLISDHALGAVPPRALGSPRNHRRLGVWPRGAVPPFVLGLSRNHRRRGVGSSRFLRLFVLTGCRHHSRCGLDGCGLTAETGAANRRVPALSIPRRHRSGAVFLRFRNGTRCFAARAFAGTPSSITRPGRLSSPSLSSRPRLARSSMSMNSATRGRDTKERRSSRSRS